MKTKTKILLVAALASLLASCRPEIPMVNLGIDEVYAVERMRALILHPEFNGDAYVWSMKASDGSDSVVSTERDLVFCSADTGEYLVRLEISDAENPYVHETRIVVWEEQVAYSRYISRVYEYRPAPGQFVNEMPEYEEGDTEADMLKKAEESISGANDVMISLGGFGGYVTFGFDHSVVNVPGEYDFKVYGNAFYAAGNPNPDNPNSGGSSEPGVVMVSFDRNGNGLPDDEWYELAGSEYSNPSTRHGYSITYRRPADDKPATPADGTPMTDTTYVRWTDNLGREGYISKVVYHTQAYYPEWIPEDEMTFSGTLLPDNAVDESGNGSFFVLYAYGWGYADNHPNEAEDKASFDIDWAVDASGSPVRLPCVDFIRVYTGVNQQCGWIGETSTEITRAEDLHVEDMTDY